MTQIKEKLWGVYNTFDDPEIFETLDEIDLWIKIDGLSQFIFDNMDFAKVSPQDLLDAQYNLDYLIYSTRKFGVEFSKEPSATEQVERKGSYLAWYIFWHKHFNSMTKQVLFQFLYDKENGKDISKYMPSGNWKDSLEKKEKEKIK